MSGIEEQKHHAADWFRLLRDRICAEFERIEEESASLSTSSHPHLPTSAGIFTRTPWTRAAGGGGEISVLKGRVFEKAGVNISIVHGEFSEAMRKEIPGAAEHPQFWASGISLVAHMRSPLVPAVHMNTRMLVLGKPSEVASCGLQVATKSWFGGGADLTPTFPLARDTADFHDAFRQACDRFSPDYYPKFKQWCDEYFFIRHRNEARGEGGIFYDYLNSGIFVQDFDFTKVVGETLLDVYPVLVRRHMHEQWTPEQKRAQLIKRGRYAEFNLLYDRGTRFGLMTDGNPEAILMSLPPEAVWE